MEMKIILLFLASLLLPESGQTQTPAVFAQGRLPRVIPRTVSAAAVTDADKYAGQWKMSSWDGTYRLFENGHCTVVDPGNPGKHAGIWFLAYDRLYLVWSWGPVVDVFKLNPDNHTVLQRIDHNLTNVTFQKKID